MMDTNCRTGKAGRPSRGVQAARQGEPMTDITELHDDEIPEEPTVDFDDGLPEVELPAHAEYEEYTTKQLFKLYAESVHQIDIVECFCIQHIDDLNGSYEQLVDRGWLPVTQFPHGREDSDTVDLALFKHPDADEQTTSYD